MEPEIKGIPYVRVTTQSTEAHAEKEWLIYEDPNASDEDNIAFIQHNLISIWNELYHNRIHGMQRPFIWSLHPHMYKFCVEKVGYAANVDRVTLRAGINISGICDLILNMERWYIPLLYGEEIIRWHINRYPITSIGISRMITKRNPIAVTMFHSTKYVRQSQRIQGKECISGRTLHHLCKDMMRDAFHPAYLTGSLSEPVLLSFMKPLTQPWDEFTAPLDRASSRLNIYSSLLIAAMSIMADGNVDDMCAIELWGAVETFVANIYPLEDIDALVHVVQEYRRYSGTQPYNLTYEAGEYCVRV